MIVRKIIRMHQWHRIVVIVRVVVRWKNVMLAVVRNLRILLHSCIRIFIKVKLAKKVNIRMRRNCEML